jgi:ABC-2 type transport system permease protein
VKYALFVVVLLALVAIRVISRVRRRRGAAADTATQPVPRAPARARFAPWTGDIGLVATREIRERVRGKVFRIGTLLILAVVAGAIIIPKLTHSTSPAEQVGVVGTFPASARSAVTQAARSTANPVQFRHEPDVASAKAALRAGTLDLAVINGHDLVVDQSISPDDTSSTAQLAQAVAANLGVDEALASAHLTAAQSAALHGARPVPVQSLQPGAGKPHKVNSTAVIGLILIFIMLTQYNTWILIGVMEEKSSRVIEVLLAAIRPIQLLTGKVLGIGLVAFGQAGLVVAFALVLAKAVGSPILHGTAPLVVGSTLLWLVLGYAFYCWVYAAAGSMAERQDQVQSLALPLSLPIILGYIFSLTAATSGDPSTFLKVLAFFPPTAPFAMPVLVGLSAVTWWEFAASAALTIVCTVGVARLATSVYRRAILRTGGRVRLRQVLARAA